MVVLATVATVIASQAVISGAFSVTRQAVQLGFLPRLTIRHTSAREIGQVYVPAVNWFAAGRRGRAGARLRLLDPPRLRLRDRRHRHDHRRHPALPRRRPRALAQTGAGWWRSAPLVFFTVDLAFLGANLTKAAHGGWFPLSIGVVVFTVLSTWKRGSEKVREARIEEEGSLRSFVEELRHDGAAGGAGAGHRRLPQRPPRNDAAGAAGRGRAHLAIRTRRS